MKTLLFIFMLLFSVQAEDPIKQEVDLFLKKLDGNFKERKVASKQLNNLPVAFYPHLKKHLEGKDVSMEVKLRLTKEKMFPLRAQWLHHQRMQWYRLNLIDAYEVHGQKNPKWDGDVKRVLDLVLKQFDEYWFIDTYGAQIAQASQAAFNKGCKDPLVLYFLARGSRLALYKKNNNKLKRLHLDAYKALKGSQYHSYFKFRAARLAGNYAKEKQRSNQKPSAKDLKNAIAFMHEAVPFYEECLADKDFPFVEFYYNSDQFCNVYSDVGGTRAKALSLIKPIMVKAYGEGSMRALAVEGWVNSNEVSNVSRDSYEAGKALRKVAYDQLSRAWEQDPAAKDIAVRLMDVAHQFRDKALVEKWYKNVLLAEPMSRDAFSKKVSFLKSYGSVDDLWQYADEVIERGGRMLGRVPDLVKEISYKVANGPDYFFGFDALQRNERAWSVYQRSFTKYQQEFPENKNIAFDEAYYAAKCGLWQKAHGLYEKAGDVNSYQGQLDLVVVKEMKDEAGLYVNRQLAAPKAHFVDFESRLQLGYEQLKATGSFNFWQFYQANNDVDAEGDTDIKEVLETLGDRWCGKPSLGRDYMKSTQIPYEKLSRLRQAGNKDPLVYLLWAEIKDSWFADDKSDLFLAAQQILEGNYPSSIKSLAICLGVSKLSKQKKVTESEKAIALGMTKALVETIDEKHVWIEQYYYLFDGLKELKLLSKEQSESIVAAFIEKNQKAEAYIVEGYFNNKMAWYTHSLSKKKNWKLIHSYNRNAKVAMKKAWLEAPLNSSACEGLFRYSDPKDKDYSINLRRALYTNIATDKVLKKFMNENSSAHSRSRKWMSYSNPYSKITLLHYEHAEYDASRSKSDKSIRADHWTSVKKSFETYLAKYPNDTIARSKYAHYAIKIGKAVEAKEQLQKLGKYAIGWAFGDAKKLAEYQKKYLKE